MADKAPNYADVIREILKSANGPVAINDLVERILLERPTHARKPHAAALTKIREEVGWQLVYLDADHILPNRLAFQGARFRIRVQRANIDHAALSIDECFHNYLPRGFDSENMHLIDSQGAPIPFKILKAPHTVSFSAEIVEYHAPVILLADWFRSQHLTDQDHILITIEDWERGFFRLEVERPGDQRPDLIAERNRYFADEMYKMLEAAKYEDAYLSEVLPTIYARMPDKGGYPPDHWLVILEQDQRMVTDGWSIHYSDSGFSPFERMVAEVNGQSLVSPGQSYSPEEAKRIYRFCVVLKHKPSIWREVEIRGGQTLEELDGILRSVFQHDLSDHLSGYWKRVARVGGARKRYREVDIGTVNPFEYAEGSDTVIAALKLAIGDQVKFVYDFGDWIEHTLELKSVGDAEKGVRYPREVARNKPKFEDCVDCRERGKQTVAKWICYTCSNEEQREVVLCGRCARKHDDHYVDEILY